MEKIKKVFFGTLFAIFCILALPAIFVYYIFWLCEQIERFTNGKRKRSFRVCTHDTLKLLADEVFKVK